MTHLIVEVLNNPISLGILCFALVMFPIIGIAKIHEPPNGTNKSRASSDTERMSGND
jgi:hypothetical protein